MPAVPSIASYIGARPAAGTGPFSTSFPATESPVSESGAWTHNASNSWQKIQTTGGNAVPIVANAGGAPSGPPFDDDYAYLVPSAFTSTSNDYEVIVTIYKGTATNGECEILLRMSDSASTASAYECLCNIGGGVAIVRWDGALNSFTTLATSPALTDPGGLANGDKLRARIVGSTISMWYARAATPTTWVSIGSTTDSTYTTGQPGMGFFQRDSAQLDFGFQDYTVTAL